MRKKYANTKDLLTLTLPIMEIITVLIGLGPILSLKQRYKADFGCCTLFTSYNAISLY
jgi:hypothetical protein